MKTTRFKVTKMKCSGCVNSIRNGLSDMLGIQNIDTDLSNQIVTVTHTDAPHFETLLSAKLKAIGYEGEMLEQAV